MLRELLVSLDSILSRTWYILATFTPVLPWRQLLGLFAGAAMCAGGIILARSGLQDIGYSYQSRAWPQTTGQVIEAGLVQRGDNFQAIIRYYYQVGDLGYNSETLGFGTTDSTDRAQAEHILERYPIGATVQVAYYPDDPSLACLEPGAPPYNAFSKLLISSVFLFLGGAVVRDIWRHSHAGGHRPS